MPMCPISGKNHLNECIFDHCVLRDNWKRSPNKRMRETVSMLVYRTVRRRHHNVRKAFQITAVHATGNKILSGVQKLILILEM